MNRLRIAAQSLLLLTGAFACGGHPEVQGSANPLTAELFDVDVLGAEGALHLRVYPDGRTEYAFQEADTDRWQDGAVRAVQTDGAPVVASPRVASALGRQLYEALSAHPEALAAGPVTLTLTDAEQGESQVGFVRARVATVAPLGAEPHRPTGGKGAEPHDEDEAEPHKTSEAEPHGPTLNHL